MIDLSGLDYRAVALVLLAGAGLIWYQQRTVEKIVEEVTSDDGALNPTNPDNIANSAFDGLWQGLTGSDESFGADMYDLFNRGSIYATD